MSNHGEFKKVKLQERENKKQEVCVKKRRRIFKGLRAARRNLLLNSLDGTTHARAHSLRIVVHARSELFVSIALFCFVNSGVFHKPLSSIELKIFVISFSRVVIVCVTNQRQLIVIIFSHYGFHNNNRLRYSTAVYSRYFCVSVTTIYESYTFIIVRLCVDSLLVDTYPAC